MGKDGAGARLWRGSQIIELLLLTLEPSGEKLLHLDAPQPGPALHSDLEQPPIPNIEDQEKA